MGFPAVRLFVERARATKPDFVLGDEDVEAVVDICRHLDGSPLALELAAARIRMLSVASLRAHLGDAARQSALKVLTGGARDLPARHQTLRSAIDWSYALLGENEQVLFRRFGVFHGGCAFEALEAICPAPEGQDETELDVFGGIATLVEHSLALQRELRGEERYVMLETIREYAAEKLAAGGVRRGARRARGSLDAVEERHARYYLDLAEQAEPQLTGPQQKEWLHRLEHEHGNLRAALSWLGEHDLPDAACSWRVRSIASGTRVDTGWKDGAGSRACSNAHRDAATTSIPRPMRVRSIRLLASPSSSRITRRCSSSSNNACKLRRSSGDLAGEAQVLNLLGGLALQHGGHKSRRESTSCNASNCAESLVIGAGWQ